MASPTGLATLEVSRDRADLGSYGEWQDPDLANFRASRDRADLGSYGEWQDLDLAIFLRVKWQDLGQDPRSCHFFCVKMARSRARSMFKLYGDSVLARFFGYAGAGVGIPYSRS